MSPAALILHTWRLKRIRRAMRTLNRRLNAYERAYGKVPPVLGKDEASQ